MAIMYETPTLEDFVDLISEPLEQAVASARKAVSAVQHVFINSQGSSRMAFAIYDAVEVEFEKGLSAAFARYQREEKRQLHEAEDIWRVLEERLNLYLIEIQAVAGGDRLKNIRTSMGSSAAHHQNATTVRFANTVHRRLRQLKVGSWAGEESQVTDLVIANGPYIKGDNNSVVGGSGNVVQQGTVGSHQTVVTGEQIARKVDELEKELATAKLPNEQFASIRVDIEAIKGQLSKPSPDPGIVQATVRSIQKIIEGAITGGVTSRLALIVADLAKMVGL